MKTKALFFFLGWLLNIVLLVLWIGIYLSPPKKINEGAVQQWMQSLEGKVAIVTGTSSGIGQAIAKRLGEQKVQLVLVDKDPEGSTALQKELQSKGVKSIFIKADLIEEAQRGAIVPKTLETFGKIDFLINNAGYGYTAHPDSIDLPQAKKQFEVNFWAAIDLAKQVIPVMRKQGGGMIVNVGSIAGVNTDAFPLKSSVYVASKHALVGWSKKAAKDLEGENILVKVMNPGGVKTKFYENLQGPHADYLANYVKPYYMGFDSPEKIADELVLAMPQPEVVSYLGQGKVMRLSSNLTCLLLNRDCRD